MKYNNIWISGVIFQKKNSIEFNLRLQIFKHAILNRFLVDYRLHLRAETKCSKCKGYDRRHNPCKIIVTYTQL